MSCGLFALEVGQGDAHVILDDREAVVIDAGPASTPVLQFLERFVYKVKALILTHNDRDHSAGAFKILHHLGDAGRIQSFWALQDRAPHEPANRVIARALELHHSHGLQINRLEVNGSSRVVTTFSSGHTLTLLHPDYAANLQALGQAHIPAVGPNRTSAVLRLCNSEGRGVGLWAGDLPAKGWDPLLNSADCTAEWFVVPHHGSGKDWPDTSIRKVLRAVRPKWTIVSVGSNNTYGHPAKEWIETAVALGATVICTQITQQCHAPLDALSGALLARDGLHDHPKTGTACAGTVVYSSPDGKVMRTDEHQRLVRSLKHPMCAHVSSGTTTDTLAS